MPEAKRVAGHNKAGSATAAPPRVLELASEMLTKLGRHL
jgi:hypothetical protein